MRYKWWKRKPVVKYQFNGGLFVIAKQRWQDARMKPMKETPNKKWNENTLDEYEPLNESKRERHSERIHNVDLVLSHCWLFSTSLLPHQFHLPQQLPLTRVTLHLLLLFSFSLFFIHSKHHRTQYTQHILDTHTFELSPNYSACDDAEAAACTVSQHGVLLNELAKQNKNERREIMGHN